LHTGKVCIYPVKDTGCMLSFIFFNFNQKKKTGVERVVIGDKILFEGTV